MQPGSKNCKNHICDFLQEFLKNQIDFKPAFIIFMISKDLLNKKGADFRKSTPDLGLLLMD